MYIFISVLIIVRTYLHSSRQHIIHTVNQGHSPFGIACTSDKAESINYSNTNTTDRGGR